MKLADGMGRRRCPVWLGALALVAVSVAGSARTDDNLWGPGVRMTEAVGRVMDGVRSVGDASDYGYDDGISIMAAFLPVRGKIAFDRSLTKGESYLVVGGGDDEVTDLDLAIYDKNGRAVASDTDDDASPVARFTAPATATYSISLSLYNAGRASFCVAAVLREGGYDVPKRNLVDAAAKVLLSCNVVDRQTSKPVYFQDESNRWALFGSILDSGEDITINNAITGVGPRVALAAGDSNANDLDLYVLNRDGSVRGLDEDDDANPIVIYQGQQGLTTGLKIRNAESRGRSLVLAAILKIEQ